MEHVILVAFTIEADSYRRAQHVLMPGLQLFLSSHDGPAESWWIAEDERYDGSDNDSAVFVTPGAQAAASRALASMRLTPTWNVVPRVDAADALEAFAKDYCDMNAEHGLTEVARHYGRIYANLLRQRASALRDGRPDEPEAYS